MTTWWRLVLCGCAVILAVTAGPAAWAVFTDGASVTSGTITAGAITTPTAPGAAQTTSGANVTFTPTRVGPQDGVPDKYEVLRWTAATGGVSSNVCTVTTPAPCATTNPPSGTVWFSVRARVGDNWVKESARTAYTPDLAGPTLAITSPPATACSGQVACGSAGDPSGIASVEYQLQRTRTTVILGSTVTCWNGSAYVASPCTYQPSTGTTQWRVPGTPATAYAAPGLLTSQSFTLLVRATDVYGNTTTASVTYTA